MVGGKRCAQGDSNVCAAEMSETVLRFCSPCTMASPGMYSLKTPHGTCSHAFNGLASEPEADRQDTEPS